MKKVIFCDLDNTLLFPLENQTYGIKEVDLKALQKALQDDVQLVIASVRPAEIKESISNMIGLEVDAIGLNGQQIICNGVNTILASFPVKDYLKITDDILHRFSSTNAGTVGLDGCYYTNDCSQPQPLARFVHHYECGIIKDICKINAHEAFKERNIEHVAKLLIYIDENTDDQPILHHLNTTYGKNYSFIRSNHMFIEGLCKGHSKRTGIEKYMEMNQLTFDQCYCAGDADNDIEMFEFLQDHSYCMKAGTKNARNTAKHLVENLAEMIDIITKGLTPTGGDPVNDATR